MAKSGWIGVDFDGTLAVYDGWKGPTHTGAPIPLMVERVKKWIAEGIEVRIFTARVWYQPGNQTGMLLSLAAEDAIKSWCLDNLGVVLPVTCQKDYDMVELWDDRAVQVVANTGMRADRMRAKTGGAAWSI